MTEKDNKNAQKHGGSSAIAHLADGKPFVGLAHARELEVRTKLDQAGRSEVVREGAIRLEVAANLYWDAVCKAAENGDLAALDRYVARFGWLQSKALIAWAQVKQEQGSRPGVTSDIVMASLQKEATDGDT